MIKKNVNKALLLNDYIKSKKAFALYQQPQETEVHFIAGEMVYLNSSDIDFDILPSGFLIAPYNNSKAFFIKKEDDNLRFVFSELEELSDEGFDFSIEPAAIDEQKEAYLDSINHVINTIQTTGLQKVVISRRFLVGSLIEDNFLLGFQRLRKAYPSAFVSLIYVNNQIWLGATPEILVSENNKGIFKTVALAGTQSAFDKDGSVIDPKLALWSSKEIEEQALVSRYIINCLKKIRVREYEELGPKTIKAGNLLHLLTTYSIDSEQINFQNLSSVMLSLLHPTSAVCGMPKALAEEAIAMLEQYDRELYSGFLGPVNINKESTLYVNLRTLKIENNEVFLYAGGGITEESIPEKEYAETELKMQTILKAFNNTI